MAVRCLPSYLLQPQRERGCPDNAANWSSTAFSPKTRLYYLMTLEECREIDPSEREWVSALSRRPAERYIKAIDIDTGKVAWEIAQAGTGNSKDLVRRAGDRERACVLWRPQWRFRGPR